MIPDHRTGTTTCLGSRLTPVPSNWWHMDSTQDRGTFSRLSVNMLQVASETNSRLCQHTGQRSRSLSRLNFCYKTSPFRIPAACANASAYRPHYLLLPRLSLPASDRTPQRAAHLFLTARSTHRGRLPSSNSGSCVHSTHVELTSACKIQSNHIERWDHSQGAAWVVGTY